MTAAVVHHVEGPDRPSTDVEDAPVVLPAEWHGDVLVVPDDGLREDAKLRRDALSVSTAQAITECRARFALEKLWQHVGGVPPDDLMAPNMIGVMAHEVLDHLYRADPPARTEELAEDICSEIVRQEIRRNHLSSQNAFTELVLKEVRTAYRGVFKLENPADIQVATVPVRGVKVPGLELQLAGVEIAGGVPLLGYVDRARAIGGDDSRIAIEDYKSTATSKRKREKDKYFGYGDQLRVYALGFEKLTGIRAEEARVIYSRLTRSKILDAPVTISPKALDRTAGWFASTWETHLGLAATGQYKTTDGPLCGWCPFVHICPSARENGREAKAGQPEGLIAELPLLPSLIPVGPPTGDDGPRTISQEPQEEGSTMAGTLFGREVKPWEDSPDELPSAAGYDVIGAFGLTGLAVEELYKAGIDVTEGAVASLAQSFAYIVGAVQKEAAGTTAMSLGANTRLRGALHTALETLPIPFGKDKKALDAWAVAMRDRVRMIAVVSAGLLDGKFPQAPWRDFAPETKVKAAA